MWVVASLWMVACRKRPRAGIGIAPPSLEELFHGPPPELEVLVDAENEWETDSEGEEVN